MHFPFINDRHLMEKSVELGTTRKDGDASSCSSSYGNTHADYEEQERDDASVVGLLQDDQRPMLSDSQSQRSIAPPLHRFYFNFGSRSRTGWSWSQILFLLGAFIVGAGFLRLLWTRQRRSGTDLIVGRRAFITRSRDRSTGMGCSSSQFLQSLSLARIDQDGPSRAIDRTNHSSLSLPPFKYSFSLPDCPAPRIYSSVEACDLISAFGGVYIRGDSLTRHVMNALLMLLRNRVDGALKDDQISRKACHYEGMFFDKRACYEYYQWDSQQSAIPVCDGNAHLIHQGSTDASEGMTVYESWHSKLPNLKRQRSPVFLQAVGLHLDCSVTRILPVVRSSIAYLIDKRPRPVNLWLGLHAPGSNKKAKYLETQGRAVVKELDRAIVDELERTIKGDIVDGASKSLEFYNVTEGAESFDGTHYSYQVNMEKAQILLNVLDLVWGESVARGGVV